jgi:hypothetical protein
LFLIWAAHLHDHGYDGANAIWINLDETALPMYVGGRAGNVHAQGRTGKKQFATKASLHERRAHCTLVAVVCNNAALQKKLPQFLLPNTTGTKRVWAKAVEDLGADSQVHILRDTSGWVNTKKFQAILRTLSQVCKKEVPGQRIVLVMDCAPAHIAPAVIQVARMRGLRPLLIPSRLTHLLQVLDFGVFAGFKRAFHDAHVNRLLGMANGMSTLPDWITGTIGTIRQTFTDLNARECFSQSGMGVSGKPYRPTLAAAIGQHWIAKGRRITQEEFWFLVGRKQKGVYPKLFRGMPIPVAPAALQQPAPVRRARSKTTL